MFRAELRDDRDTLVLRIESPDDIQKLVEIVGKEIHNPSLINGHRSYVVKFENLKEEKV